MSTLKYPVSLMLSPAEEEETIHGLLKRMILAPRSGYNIADMLHGNPVMESGPALDLIANRMTSEGLVEQISEEYGAYQVLLTSRGIEAARHADGYLGYQKASFRQRLLREQAQQEKDASERQANEATVKSAGYSRYSLWISLFAFILSVAVFAYSIIQQQNSAAELEVMRSQIKALQQKTASLK